MASTGQLEGMGLVAEPEKPAPPIFRLSRTDRIRTDKWPSYQRCVNDAPLNHDKTGPDISRADFTWCMTAISWGHGIEATAERLMEESSKARENGERYARLFRHFPVPFCLPVTIRLVRKEETLRLRRPVPFPPGVDAPYHS
jgi:hypothetical protein